MKRLLVFAMVLSLLCTMAFAHTDGGLLGDVPQTSEAITVDAVKDAIYDFGLSVPITYPNGTSDVKATANAWLLSKDGYLYVYAEIKDADVVVAPADLQTSSPWSIDSLELFINSDNSDDNAATTQYRIDNEGWPCVYDQNGRADYGPDAVGSAFMYAEVDTSAGYNVEFAVPVTGSAVGINFQVNDVSSDGSDQTWAMVHSDVTGSGSSSWTAGDYPYITIGGSTVSLPVEVVEETPAADEAPAADTSAATTAPAAAQTSDIIPAAVVMALLGAAGLVICKKRG